jgi:hypothetical protein
MVRSEQARGEGRGLGTSSSPSWRRTWDGLVRSGEEGGHGFDPDEVAGGARRLGKAVAEDDYASPRRRTRRSAGVGKKAMGEKVVATRARIKPDCGCRDQCAPHPSRGARLQPSLHLCVGGAEGECILPISSCHVAVISHILCACSSHSLALDSVTAGRSGAPRRASSPSVRCSAPGVRLMSSYSTAAMPPIMLMATVARSGHGLMPLFGAG